MYDYLDFPCDDTVAATQNAFQTPFCVTLQPHPHSVNTHIESNATHLLRQKISDFKALIGKVPLAPE